MKETRREFAAKLAKLSASGAIVSRWAVPVVTSVALPAHAQTSDPAQCGEFEVEAVNEPILIVIDPTEVAGPVTAPRQGDQFDTEVTTEGGLCSDGVTRETSVVEFSGEFSAASNQVSGTFNVRQFCGDRLICEQIATYQATQTPADGGTELGTYEGTVTGTLRCCVD